MIKVNLAEIENLSSALIDSASKTDDSLQKLRFLSNEMVNDTELPMYTQSEAILLAVTSAVNALNRGNDTLLSLKNIILSIPDAYQELEKSHKDALNRMITTMSSLNLNYSSVITSPNTPLVEEDDAIQSQNNVQQLVADSCEDMQITNIAAISKVIEDEYNIQEIKEIDGEL